MVCTQADADEILVFGDGGMPNSRGDEALASQLIRICKGFLGGPHWKRNNVMVSGWGSVTIQLVVAIAGNSG
jgi:hypothetical protein